MKLRSLILLLPFLMLPMTISAAEIGSLIAQPGKSPLITLRVVFQTGSASDPAGKEGLASLTAKMLAEGGTRRQPYKKIIEALFPMAAEVSWQVDQEMTTFSAETHLDNLERFYALFRQMLLEPGWREDDLRRNRDDMINHLRITLRGNNDEELGKEVLYQQIYAGHPYGHHSLGTASGLGKITIADLKEFYRAHYSQASMTLAIAGNYPAGFPARVQRDFARLEKGRAEKLALPEPKPLSGRWVTMIEKDTRSVAISLGFPVAVRRGHPDFVALLVAQSWLGQHRNSGVRLYDRIREIRGLNYGNYAYLEYFPRGMFRFEPDPNLARQQQIFQVWIRPLVPETAHFTLRLAMFELEKFHREGLSAEDFERTRNFLSKYVNLLTKTKSAELGYLIDSRFYGIAEYNAYLKTALAKLTRDEVNSAVKRHLPMENMRIVIVGSGCAALRDRIVEGAPSPMTYNSPKPQPVLEEDKIVERYPLRIRADAVRIVKVDTVFE